MRRAAPKILPTMRRAKIPVNNWVSNPARLTDLLWRNRDWERFLETSATLWRLEATHSHWSKILHRVLESDINLGWPYNLDCRVSWSLLSSVTLGSENPTQFFGGWKICDVRRRSTGTDASWVEQRTFRPSAVKVLFGLVQKRTPLPIGVLHANDGVEDRTHMEKGQDILLQRQRQAYRSAKAIKIFNYQG